MNKLIHSSYTWSTDDDSLREADLFLSNSIPGDELTIDTLDVTVDCSVETSGGRVLSVDPRTFAYGTVLTYYHNSARLAKLYFSQAKRVGKYLFTLHGVSAVGLLDKLPHPGGIYTGQTAGAVLADLYRGAVPYTVETNVAELPVYGWLPYATRRENLHQLLFALGAALTKNAAGDSYIAFLRDGTGTPIPDSRVYAGGEVSYNNPATGADVTEHTYGALASDQTATLFDNTDGSGAVTNETVVFEGPHHSLSVTSGLRIQSSGVNFAVLTGVGTLTGKKYTHQTKLISERAVGTAGEENIVTVEDATLVSVANARNVAKRVLAYYSSRRTVSMDILSLGERPGEVVTFSDPFDETSKGLVQSLTFSMAQVLRASATIITDYIPKWYGNKYNAYDMITRSGTYTIPAGVEEVLVLLVGGGQGGWSGLPGQASDAGAAPTISGSSATTANTDSWSGYGTAKGGAGGGAGGGGRGGKVNRGELAVTPGQVFSVTVGAGGTGGIPASGSQVGASGAASQFGSLRSDGGYEMDGGYFDVISGMTFALPGGAGIPGGKGSGGMENPSTDGEKQAVVDGPAVIGPDGKRYTVEAAPSASDIVESAHATARPGGSFGAMIYAKSQKGSSGGAAVGSDGRPGVAGDVSAYESSSTRVSASGTGGKGGQGGNALAPAQAASYGGGGMGGNGGGGAGGGGFCYYYKRVSKTVSATAAGSAHPGPGGTPGNGSGGGKGGDGCVVVFYRRT